MILACFWLRSTEDLDLDLDGSAMIIGIIVDLLASSMPVLRSGIPNSHAFLVAFNFFSH